MNKNIYCFKDSLDFDPRFESAGLFFGNKFINPSIY